MQADPALALSLTVLVAASYLTLLRLIDRNEKEPLWALCTMLFLGAVTAGGAALLPGEVRDQTAFGIALTAEISKALAIALGLVVFFAIKQLKGWSEVNGVVDGFVYGAAAGLGFATGSAFVSEIASSVSASQLPDQPGFGSVLWTTTLFGLSEGAFGAIIGAGLVAGLEAPSTVRAVLLSVGGFLVATAAHWAYATLPDTGSLYDSHELVGRWLPLSLSLALLAALILWGLARERGVIRDLDRPGTPSTGKNEAARADQSEVNADPDAETRDPPRRARDTVLRPFRGQYFECFVKGDLDRWLALRTLQNRRAQLAFTQRRLDRASGRKRRDTLGKEIYALRRSLGETQAKLAQLRLSRADDPKDRAIIAKEIEELRKHLETLGAEERSAGPRRLSGRQSLSARAIAALALVSGIVVISLGAAKERESRDDESTSTPPPPAGGRDDVQGAGTSAATSLQERLRQRIGPYLLAEGWRDPTALEAGAISAYRLRYEATNRPPVKHEVALFRESKTAEGWRQRVITRLERSEWEIVDEGEYEDIGPYATLERGNRSTEIWTNSPLFLVAALTSTSRETVSRAAEQTPY